CLGILAQNTLPGTEADLGLVSGFVLIDVADHALDRRQASVGLLRGLLGGLGLVASVDGMLVGFVGLIGRHLNALLGAAVHVLDHLRVGGGELVELIHAVTNRLSLTLDVFLAGKGIDLAPEALAAFVLQRRFAGCG